MEAVRRLLEGSVSPVGDVALHVEKPDGDAMVQPATWQSPDLLLHCQKCKGTGEYVALNTREDCEACAGRELIVV